jgi:hypothetical protein
MSPLLHIAQVDEIKFDGGEVTEEDNRAAESQQKRALPAGAESAFHATMDWSVVAVWSCSASCDASSEEYCYVHPPLL